MSTIQSPHIQRPSLLTPVNPDIEAYLRSLLDRTDGPVVSEMESRAREYQFPIVGRLVGVFLETMARIVNARRIFEFGSGYGYSAYWFAQAIGPDGLVIGTDSNQRNIELAQGYLDAVGLGDRVEFHTGFAQDIFRQTNGLFDICYNDVDKGDYPDVWLLARERIRPGGLYIADNTLWHGRVAMKDYVDEVPGWTEAILEHNRLIFNDPEFDAFINPTRDGVIIARKKTA